MQKDVILISASESLPRSFVIISINSKIQNMKKSLISLVLLGLLASCAQMTANSVNAGFITNWKDRDPISRVDNGISSTKKGEACVKNILHIYVEGDSSIETAKKNGGVKNVAYVDRTFEAVFPFYQKGCTIVRGN